MAVASIREAAALAPPRPRAPAVVRGAESRDIPSLMRLKRQMAEAEGTAQLLDATAEDWARDCLGAAPKFFALVAEADGTLVGMTMFNEQHFAGWQSPVLYVQDVFVLPDHRRRGIGRALLARVAGCASERGASLVYLNVHESNPARRMYAAAGFAFAQKCVVHALMGPALHKLAQTAEP